MPIWLTMPMWHIYQKTNKIKTHQLLKHSHILTKFIGKLHNSFLKPWSCCLNDYEREERQRVVWRSVGVMKDFNQDLHQSVMPFINLKKLAKECFRFPLMRFCYQKAQICCASEPPIWQVWMCLMLYILKRDFMVHAWHPGILLSLWVNDMRALLWFKMNNVQYLVLKPIWPWLRMKSTSQKFYQKIGINPTQSLTKQI